MGSKGAAISISLQATVGLGVMRLLLLLAELREEEEGWYRPAEDEEEEVGAPPSPELPLSTPAEIWLAVGRSLARATQLQAFLKLLGQQDAARRQQSSSFKLGEARAQESPTRAREGCTRFQYAYRGARANPGAEPSHPWADARAERPRALARDPYAPCGP